jgi:hypothetical protein
MINSNAFQNVDTCAGAEPSEIQASVRAAWCQALRIQPQNLDPDRGFVESGGYSLAALRLIDTIRSLFAVEIELPEILESMSANAMAERVAAAVRAAAFSKAGRDDPAAWEEGFI